MASVLDRLVRSAFGENGTVEQLVISPRPGEHRVVDEILVVTGVGVLGDHDRKQVWRGARVPGREISAINAEVLDALGIPPAAPGDNLIIRGVDLRAIPPGMILLIGDLPLRRTAAAHRPCRLFWDRTSGISFRIAAQGWRGALFDALTKGTIRAGDPVRFEP
jgi:MOSC domain-containing protein YiiM